MWYQAASAVRVYMGYSRERRRDILGRMSPQHVTVSTCCAMVLIGQASILPSVLLGMEVALSSLFHAIFRMQFEN